MSAKRSFLFAICVIGAAVSFIHLKDRVASLVLIVLAVRELNDGWNEDK